MKSKEKVLHPQELNKVLKVLEASGNKGMSLHALARESSIDIDVIRQNVMLVKDYIVQLPESKAFAINRYGEFKGSTSRMMDHYQNKLKTKRITKTMLILLFVFLFYIFFMTGG